MARIRSTHPGQWTDEDFVQCSPMARLLVIGLRNEADDNGVFEWKPLALKMRLFPADDVDVTELLAEVVENRQAVKFEEGGKSYGAIRNFRKYQRPKKPNSVYPLPNEFRTYVGLKDDGSEPVPHQFPTASEKSPQMEDGGGRMEDGGDEKEQANACSKKSDAAELLDIPEKLDRRKGRRLESTWTLPADYRDWCARELGWPGEQIDDTAEQFRDYWISVAGGKGVKLDWFAVWRNWCRRDFNGRGSRQRPDSDVSAFARAQNALETLPADDIRRRV